MMHVEASDDGLGAACSIAGSAHPSTHHTAPKPTMTSRANATSRRMRRDSSIGRRIYCHEPEETMRVEVRAYRSNAAFLTAPPVSRVTRSSIAIRARKRAQRWTPKCGAQSSNVTTASRASASSRRRVAVKSQPGGGSSGDSGRFIRVGQPLDDSGEACSSAGATHDRSVGRSRCGYREATSPATT